MLALTFNRPTHQLDHLLCYGQTKARSLNAVDTAVCLTGERLIHSFHELRTHTDTRIGYNISQPYTSGQGTLFFSHFYTDTPTGFSVLDGVGEDIDIYLVQTELVCIQVFLFHPIDIEAEFNILFLDHRL